MTLSAWLKKEHIPALEITDTRLLTQKIRDKGALLGKIVITNDVELYDPNVDNLVEQVSTKVVMREGRKSKTKPTIVLIDCGGKRNIKRNLLQRNVEVITVPWDYDIFKNRLEFDAVVISNGPGDPKIVIRTIGMVKQVLYRKIPIFGICLGNQILALAAGGDTYKLKFGHRGQNQPCIQLNDGRCYLTTQNHGFAVGAIPPGFKPWFVNANDNTNEGIMHTKYPFFSAQFHPESTPGPLDTEWLFDYFLEKIDER